MEHQARDDVERWFLAHGDQVLAYLLHRTDRESAQDLVQEVFVTALRRHRDVPEPAVGWLIGCARKLLANARRGSGRRDRLVHLLGSESSRSDPTGDHTPAQDLADVLHGVSAADQEVLTLSAWYELTAEEAARALGCTPAAYRVRLHRARRRLAHRLRPEPGHPRTATPRLGGAQ